VVNARIKASGRKSASATPAPTSRRWLSLARDRWVSYPAGDAGLQRLGELLVTPPRVRMPCLLLYGVSGAGKSMLLEKFQRAHAETCQRRSGRRLIVAAQMPPVPHIRSLYGEIIRALDANASPAMRLYDLECTAVAMLKHAAPRMLVIDEIQHLLSCSPREQRAALNAVKYLANQLRISIVAAGTHESLHVMRYDSQIASRFEQMELPVWSESEELLRFIAGYLALLPIRRSRGAIDKRFVEYLLELTDGVTGRIIDVLRRTALHAMTNGTGKVDLEQLQRVGARLPTIVGQRT
jgi:Cdc6-like AAA superfamily ATPase